MDDKFNKLELMLNQREEILSNNEETTVTTSNIISDAKYPLKSTKNATLFDFIKMVDKLCSLTLKNAKFVPDEKTLQELDIMKNIDKPVITYKVIERIPKKEIKPRLRETIKEKDEQSGLDKLGEIWGQKFECIIQFDIIASEYKEANEVMNDFEDLIFTYAGFFKRNGISEIYFKKHLTDSHLDNLRENLSIRSLQYYVEIEKVTVIFREKIKEIEILAQKEGGK